MLLLLNIAKEFPDLAGLKFGAVQIAPRCDSEIAKEFPDLAGLKFVEMAAGGSLFSELQKSFQI